MSQSVTSILVIRMVEEKRVHCRIRTSLENVYMNFGKKFLSKGHAWKIYQKSKTKTKDARLRPCSSPVKLLETRFTLNVCR